ncbi:helix-turn-helix protein [Halanaerobium congolense]|uniref:Helix-turn-helix protein n=1 Tax=Halanaerobium congolense TaxID=54121 RepID=A0A4R8G771_9FIRM|nr:helix-turn-helix domain-containing protein [Halanaerobium congolense]TDX40306.1 helix-turn-helix protein [Halanaerobium congolense]
MDYLNNTPNPRRNKHLNAYERGQISSLHSKRMSAYAIDKRLNRASNTIRVINELKRDIVSQIKVNKKFISTSYNYIDAGLLKVCSI